MLWNLVFKKYDEITNILEILNKSLLNRCIFTLFVNDFQCFVIYFIRLSIDLQRLSIKSLDSIEKLQQLLRRLCRNSCAFRCSQRFNQSTLQTNQTSDAIQMHVCLYLVHIIFGGGLGVRHLWRTGVRHMACQFRFGYVSTSLWAWRYLWDFQWLRRCMWSRHLIRRQYVAAYNW